jgi:hypothetical protein
MADEDGDVQLATMGLSYTAAEINAIAGAVAPIQGVLSGGVNALEFDSLDINSDGGSYNFEAELIAGSSSGGSVSLRVNGNSTASNYERTPVGGTNSSTNAILTMNTSASGNSRATLSGRISRVNSRILIELEVHGRVPSFSVGTNESFHYVYTPSVTNLTSFSLNIASAVFNSGSRARIYKNGTA